MNRAPLPSWFTLRMAGIDRPGGPPARPSGVVMHPTDTPANRQQRRLARRMQRRQQKDKPR
jgi:hypothetical protein